MSKAVQITKNAKLKKAGDGVYWLLTDSSAGPALFNLTAVSADPVTGERRAEIDNILEAFMNEQHMPIIESPN